MKKRYSYLITSTCIFICFQIFIFSSNWNSEDELHQKEFNSKYKIFSIVKPETLYFADEKAPISDLKIWERFDKELLKNIYWQSNTLLYFKRANKYFPVIESILQENNIPEDFKYLAIIESGLENVVSPAGATGFWQIMKSTAKEYGLEVNSEVDERYHLTKATYFACKYLQEGYEEFGSWTMAAAAYNMGINGARRIIKEQESNNYYNLYMNSETSRYIFRILAVKEILSNPNKYGFVFREKDLYTPVVTQEVILDSSHVNLFSYSKGLGINYKILKEYNPWFRSNILTNPSKKKYLISIPKDAGIVFSDHN